mmetsp:Transcript_5672/g.9188  ORF Transcript_5672/g.9188 Transcript_5672/m.9188 type:complete len:219 (-) Transcript_5672:946-1602(-)
MHILPPSGHFRQCITLITMKKKKLKERSYLKTMLFGICIINGMHSEKPPAYEAFPNHEKPLSAFIFLQPSVLLLPVTSMKHKLISHFQLLLTTAELAHFHLVQGVHNRLKALASHAVLHVMVLDIVGDAHEKSAALVTFTKCLLSVLFCFPWCNPVMNHQWTMASPCCSPVTKCAARGDDQVVGVRQQQQVQHRLLLPRAGVAAQEPRGREKEVHRRF